MTPTEVAAESFAFWRPLVRLPLHAYALLGNEDGEVGMKLAQTGDHGEAFGCFQWHGGRADAMALPAPHGCGIDVRTASHLDQLRAAQWEMQHGVGYRHVWSNLMVTEDLEDAVAVLVREYEHSSLQARDIMRRTGYARKWQLLLPWPEAA